ncbi:MAG: hypothetical protein QME94_12340, partial [Anaerolineae bacterium]|nr:hypothetical protein [Anaerolineae bacterium]
HEPEGTTYETNIEEYYIKAVQQDQIAPQGPQGGDLIDASAWGGLLKEARVVDHGPDHITVYMTYSPIKGPAREQEVSLRRDDPVLKLHYINWCVNIVDIATPGGTRMGAYQIYGAENWKRGYTFYPEIYFSKYPGDVGYENITEIEDPTPLSYRGWLIMGIFNPANGIGYGRCVPAETIDCLKLLFREDRLGRRGFELFPCWGRPNVPFDSYLFPVTGGAEDVLARGKRIVDDHLAAETSRG